MSRPSNIDAQIRQNWGDEDALPGPMNGAVGRVPWLWKNMICVARKPGA